MSSQCFKMQLVSLPGNRGRKLPDFRPRNTPTFFTFCKEFPPTSLCEWVRNILKNQLKIRKWMETSVFYFTNLPTTSLCSGPVATKCPQIPTLVTFCMAIIDGITILGKITFTFLGPVCGEIANPHASTLVLGSERRSRNILKTIKKLKSKRSYAPINRLGPLPASKRCGHVLVSHDRISRSGEPTFLWSSTTQRVWGKIWCTLAWGCERRAWVVKLPHRIWQTIF